KASRLWTGATNSLLDINGLRHVMQPSVNYAFVPRPSAVPSQLPQFDSESPASLLLPVDFYDYNNIDSIDSQNVIRFGIRNTLQTKRADQVDNLVDWNLMMDWRLNPQSAQPTFANQQTFSDLYSDLTFRPRAWVGVVSQLRYDINGSDLNLAFHQLALTPNDRWSWGLGHLYLRNGFLGAGDNFITSTMFYRVNENWGLRSLHNFNAQNGRLQEQHYTIYRDLRSWTGALTFRVNDNGIGPKDYTIAFTFSLKAHPRYAVGDDTVQAYHLVGE
ncbi:MAG: LPS assembly protein LptD, partial [Verrucomicrobiota bacterium]